jgi:hypothetical protein
MCNITTDPNKYSTILTKIKKRGNLVNLKTLENTKKWETNVSHFFVRCLAFFSLIALKIGLIFANNC